MVCSIRHTRSMKTCLDILATVWPTMRVAKAARHGRYNPGRMFGLGLSLAPIGQKLEGYVDRPGVSR
jgi:hypothetical protein